MKIILVLLDGLGDRAFPELGNRTPLQAADTPNLDRLAAAGSNGLFHASFPGQCLPSEIAHYLLFGYELETFPGRGLLEAVGEGITFEADDVLCLAHLARVDWQDDFAVLKQGRDDLAGSREDLSRVYGLIDRFETDGIRFRLEQTHRNDAILVIHGPVSDRISDSDPIRLGLPVAQVEALSEASDSRRADHTAAALNAYLQHCYEVLEDAARNPYRRKIAANFLVTQRSGRRRPQTPFRDLWGVKGAMIASSAVYAGLAQEIGLDVIPATDSASPGDDLRERIARAVADTDHDFIHVHTKAPDAAAHKGDPAHKRDVISLLDAGFDALIQTMEHRNDILLAVTADHSTPCDSLLVHSGEPVPVLIRGPNVRRDRVRAFSEIDAASGCLGMLRGGEILAMLLNYADRSVFYGHRLGSEAHRFFAPQYRPFKRR